MSHSLILIGGFGFVGRNALDVLAQNPGRFAFDPVVVDDLSNAAPGYERLNVKAHIGPYEEEAATSFLNGLRAERRTFIFLAGETRVAESKDRPLDFIAANITQPSRFVLNNVNPGDHFVLISTAGALFDGTTEVSVDAPYSPKNFYGASKAAEEMILEKLVGLRGGKFSVIRLTNVYGVHSDRKKSAIHAFTRAAIVDGTVTINGDGQQSRDFIFSEDVGLGIVTLANRVRLGEPADRIYMLGSGRSTTLWEVVTAIESATGRSLKYHQVPAADLLATEPRDVIARKSDVTVLLGKDITPLERGIDRTVNYYFDINENIH